MTGIIRSLKTQVPALAIAVVAWLTCRECTRRSGAVTRSSHHPWNFANVPRARLVLIVEADGHHPARFDINPNDGDIYLEVTTGSPLAASSKHSPSAPLTVDARSLKIPAKAVRELDAAGRHIREGELDKALSRLQKSIQLHPAYDVAYNDMGVVYLKMGRYQEAGAGNRESEDVDLVTEGNDLDLESGPGFHDRAEQSKENIGHGILGTSGSVSEGQSQHVRNLW
jgi:tetratricopeptide (TPR) repeat protein